MPEDFDPEDYEGLQPAQSTIHNAELRKLRKAEKELQEMKAKVAAMERREVFSVAGVPPDDPAAQWFMKGYDGELTPDAIRQAATLARIPITGQTSQEVTQQEIQGHQAALNAAAGATSPTAAMDYEAKLREMSTRTFAPTDDVGREQHIRDIAALAKEAGVGIPIR